MAKTVKLTFNDKEYTLEFTRATLEKMEADGYSIADAQTKIVTWQRVEFEYAFFANHKRMKKEDIKKIYDRLTNKRALIEKLSEMMLDCINSIYDEPEEEKNAISWTATF